ncbi:MAG TPA: NHL repeat-containing protein [Ferruginibacter sp.]|nr:NHL repeat-containing protein [Ferruginibacter sp.]HNN70724.1 NHL repeat-containing protein [Ferruginibacter sp.]
MKKNIFLSLAGLFTLAISSCKKDDAPAPAPTPTPVPTSYVATTLAGSTAGYVDGTGAAAQFNMPTGIVRDAGGNLFVCDRDNNRIRKITPAGLVTTFAGSGAPGFVNGTGTAAQFNMPYGLAIDQADNIYVADRFNTAIRKITPAGVVTTLAGGSPGFADGTGAAAQFNELYGIAIDGSGNLIVPDFFNYRIRKVTPAGVVTTLAGTGSSGFTDGPANTATFRNPFGAAVDASGNVYVADYYNHAIRKITPAGVVSTIAGSGTSGSADGTGSAASFRQPAAIAFDGSGNLIVCDAMNNTIRKVTPAGVVTTILGSSTASGNSNGTGTAALFNNPIGICGDFANNTFYIADLSNHLIRKIRIQ